MSDDAAAAARARRRQEEEDERAWREFVRKKDKARDQRIESILLEQEQKDAEAQQRREKQLERQRRAEVKRRHREEEQRLLAELERQEREGEPGGSAPGSVPRQGRARARPGAFGARLAERQRDQEREEDDYRRYEEELREQERRATTPQDPHLDFARRWAGAGGADAEAPLDFRHGARDRSAPRLHDGNDEGAIPSQALMLLDVERDILYEEVKDLLPDPARAEQERLQWQRDQELDPCDPRTSVLEVFKERLPEVDWRLQLVPYDQGMSRLAHHAPDQGSASPIPSSEVPAAEDPQESGPQSATRAKLAALLQEQHERREALRQHNQEMARIAEEVQARTLTAISRSSAISVGPGGTAGLGVASSSSSRARAIGGQARTSPIYALAPELGASAGAAQARTALAPRATRANIEDPRAHGSDID